MRAAPQLIYTRDELHAIRVSSTRERSREEGKGEGEGEGGRQRKIQRQRQRERQKRRMRKNEEGRRVGGKGRRGKEE